jgi:hypothetical protein
MPKAVSKDQHQPAGFIKSKSACASQALIIHNNKAQHQLGPW